MSTAQALSSYASAPSPINWRGQSGCHYALSPQKLDQFCLLDSTLYVLAHDGVALWVGAANDLIEDYASRQKFKLALKKCSEVYRYDLPLDDAARQRMVWDLEFGRIAPQLRLVE